MAKNKVGQSEQTLIFKISVQMETSVIRWVLSKALKGSKRMREQEKGDEDSILRNQRRCK